MMLLARELEHASVVSIGHRPELADFHDRKIVLERGRKGARLAGDIHPAPQAGRTAPLRGRTDRGGWSGAPGDAAPWASVPLELEYVAAQHRPRTRTMPSP